MSSQPIRILLIDDNDGTKVASLLSGIDGGFELRRATNAGGRELAESISELRPDTKVLYMSGYTDDAIVRHGILDDNTFFLQKPFTPNSLALKVRDALDQTPLPQSTSQPRNPA